MKLKIAMIMALALMTMGCTTRIEPGYAGIKVNYSGTGRGVEDFPVTNGRVWYNPLNESILEYPTMIKTVSWTRSVDEGNPVNEEITFTTKEGLQVSADISASYQLKYEEVPRFYVKFRNDDLDTFTHGFFRNVTRDTFDKISSSYGVEQIIGDNAEFMAKVKEQLQGELTAYGVDVIHIGFIGAPRPPQAVIDSINAKVQATQKAFQLQNEVEQTKAQAAKNVAEAEGNAKARMLQSEAEAAANIKIANSITANLVEYKKLEKWDGKLPQVSGSNGGILLNLK